MGLSYKLDLVSNKEEEDEVLKLNGKLKRSEIASGRKVSYLFIRN